MKRILSLFFFFIFLFKLEAQPFSLDTTFHSSCPPISPYFIDNCVRGLIQEPSGNLLIYGQFRDYSSPYINSIRNDYFGNTVDSWYLIGDNLWAIESIKLKDSIYYLYHNSDIISKHNQNGETDTSWSNNTLRCFTWGNQYPADYFILPDHRILLGGRYRFNPYPGPYIWKHFIRLQPNGLVDSSFTHDTDGDITKILTYPNNKLILGGYFQYYDSIPIKKICRIDTSGNLDTSFRSIFTFGDVIPRFIQDDGKIIVNGFFKIENNPDTLTMVRLNPDGSLDSTFNNFNNIPFQYINGRINIILTLCKTTDGGYLIGGRIDIYQGYTRKNILKTDINGFIDTNYFYDGGVDSTKFPYLLEVRKIEQAPGGQYYVMGCFRTYYDQLVPPIIRINSITNGVHNPAKPNEYFLLFPNPATTEATIRFSMLTSGGKLRVYNTLGQIITEEEIPQGINEYKLNVNRYKSGLYKVILLEKNEVKGQQSMVIHR